MYGTVARLRVKPGQEEALIRLTREEDEQLDVPGYVSTSIYRLDSDPSTYVMAVVFESRELYRANAESPDQHARYLQFRELLEADPEWEDGEIVYPQTG